VRRFPLALGLLALVLAAPAAAHDGAGASWARGAIAADLKAGLFPGEASQSGVTATAG